MAAQEELAVAQAFVALLEEERAELLAANPARLPEIAERKVAVAQRLAALARARGARPGAELAALAGRALAQIRDNSMLVDARLRAVGQALAVLLRAPADPARVYSADGRWQSARPGAQRTTA